jgi:ATP-dependent DNA ligase
MLAKALQGIKGVTAVPWTQGDGIGLYAAAEALGLEGVIAKRQDSIYLPGRSPHWQKFKTPAGKARDQKRLGHLK